MYDVIVIGTGAGGSTAARELSSEGLNVLILEKGKSYKAGTAASHITTTGIDLKPDELDIHKISRNRKLNFNPDYDFFNFPSELLHVEGMGGTTTVTLANACYSCSACYHNSAITQLKAHDLNLFEELIETSGDLNVTPLPREFMGSATMKIAKAAEELGYIVEPMPKFIDFEKCDSCGLCINGCPKKAKWDASHFVREATQDGATLVEDFEVTRVLHEEGKVTGVEGRVDGQVKKFNAQKVVLSAGSLNTPHILRNSGITEGVGEGLFVDLFITIGGYLKGAGLNREIPMGIKSEFGPYFLSPHFSNQLVSFLQEKGFDARDEDILGIMVKIADDATGKILEDGTIEKKLTTNDVELLKEGYHKAAEVLLEAGVDESSLVCTPIRGAHPGGTAAIGRVVDRSLETPVEGLFIADASVIERAPGRPPILTITAIGKSVAKTITKQIKN